MKALSRILVIKLGSIGEFVLSLPAMSRIRQAHARADITLLTTPRFAELAKSSRYFNHVEPAGDAGGLGAPFALAGWIKKSGFQRVYDLENSAATSAVFRALWPGRPEWSGSIAGASLRHRNAERSRMHVLERQADQLRAAGIWPDAPIEAGSAPPPDLSWILKRAPDPRPVPGQARPKPFVVMAPGGTSKADRRWPIESYSELAGQLYGRGFDIVIVGGPEESAMARTIQRTAGRARDLTGRTDFAQLAILGARAALGVGNDSGATHLMAAAGAPTIALFSKASDPELSGPRGYVAILRAAQLKELPVQQVAQTALGMARSS
jgi:ADP-heptose:LPS heptosyltransferase